MNGEFMTPEVLATFAGLVAATSIIVQFTKPLIKRSFSDVVVRIYTWIIAIILTFIFLANDLSIEGMVLNIINSILVATSAMGAYEVIKDPKAEKKLD